MYQYQSGIKFYGEKIDKLEEENNKYKNMMDDIIDNTAYFHYCQYDTDKNCVIDYIQHLEDKNIKLEEENKLLKEMVSLHENDDNREIKTLKEKYNNLKKEIIKISKIMNL